MVKAKSGAAGFSGMSVLTYHHLGKINFLPLPPGSPGLPRIKRGVARG